MTGGDCAWTQLPGDCDRPPFAEVSAGRFAGEVCAHHLQRITAICRREAPKSRLGLTARLLPSQRGRWPWN